MSNKEKIIEYRARLDKTLASHELQNEESIKSRIKNEYLTSSPPEIEGYLENVVEKRAKEVSHFLDMLRSVGSDKMVSRTHGAAHGEWKLKQDTDEYRVMYREGAQGTPFHTLLVEGYVNGPLDVCLCLSWEIALFHKWWPQFNFPTFKIIASECVQKVRIGEQIALVRMKVAWPLSGREVILHYFELEFLEDDLVIVVLNTVSDVKSIDRSTHGFTSKGIPEAKDIVRADLVGGFALQKVTSNRSYFRTMATMDIKLDIVPPSLINFMSRQLIGSGFKLYQKAVASVAKGDEDFGKALKDPLYARIREGLSHDNRPKKVLKSEEVDRKKSAEICPKETASEALAAYTPVIDQKPLGDLPGIQIPDAAKSNICQISPSEIEEEEIEQETHLEESEKSREPIDQSSFTQTDEQCRVSKQKKVLISSEVEHAIGILNNVISMVRGRGVSIQNWSGLGSANQEHGNTETVAGEVVSSSPRKSPNNGVSKTEDKDRILNGDENDAGFISFRPSTPELTVEEVNHIRVATSSSKQKSLVNDKPQESASNLPLAMKMADLVEAPVAKNTNYNNEVLIKVNGIHEGKANGGENFKKKKHRICCLHFSRQ